MTASGARSTFPPLSPDEAEHSHTVARMIRERLDAAGGWLSFETFMELALYAPGLGYYSAGGTKIGPGGDFTTAPEVSDLFSICVAHQCAEVLGRHAGGSVLELGAGTGRMAATILRTLDSLGALPDQYAILEVSADLRDRQRECVEQLPEDLRRRVVWFDVLPAQPVKGVILANEVLDALPCRRLVVRGDGVRELGVAAGDAFSFMHGAAAGSETGSIADGGHNPFVENERVPDEGFAASWPQPVIEEQHEAALQPLRETRHPRLDARTHLRSIVLRQLVRQVAHELPP